MQEQPSTFQVYNASAGSGKTFTLVKEYLKIILQSDDIFTFQKVLAVTFTNKAASEMKGRLLENLEAFSEGKETDIYSILKKETKLPKALIQERSKKILDVILRNYTAFSVTTIDSFTHKIIKNFAYDLGLSLNFEVEMDPTELLAEAVDMLISKIGIDKEITRVLIDFSLEKADDDKSWDISRELNEFSKLLLNEDDAKHFKSLSKKSLDDFYELKNKLNKSRTDIKKRFQEIGESALKIIENEGLEHKSFMRGTVPKFFLDIAEKGFGFSYSSRSETIEKTIREHNFYSKNAKSDVISSIENIIPKLIDCFEQTKKVYGENVLLKLTLKSIIPLAVLNNINSELNYLKDENNLRFNAEFNQLISENIKDQPAPFIYERIGQRFSYYFIDEMQDTSILQWQNLIPLISDVLASGDSKLMLVGDGKQAIYRWRGGKAEQFIGLGTPSSGENPFVVKKEVESLTTNYRSYSEIVDFTNNFFQYTSGYVQNESYKNIYIEGNKQLNNSKKGGCVSLNFVDKEEQELRYPIAVLKKINEVKENGFNLDEICVLVRSKKDGVAIASYLTEKGVGVVSSETLLLINSLKVNFVVDVVKAILYPKDQKSIFNCLYFLHQHFNVAEQKHQFISKFLNLEIQSIFKGLKDYGVNFNLLEFHQKPLYEKFEELIRGFELLDSSDAYVQFFLDVVLEQQQRGVDVQGFLEFWEQRKDKLSIAVSDASNKVQIMTIHKSKGLEFPVVIFPGDLNIYKQINPKVWFDDLPQEYNGFENLLLNYTKDIELVNSRGSQIHHQVREELELDNFNLLYVALTRPVQQLHIITDAECKKDSYSIIFKNYLESLQLWEEEKNSYILGDEKKILGKGGREKGEGITPFELDSFISTPLKEHEIKLLPNSSRYWDTQQGKAIEYGNLVHNILSDVIYDDNIEEVLSKFVIQGFINLIERQEIKGKINMIFSHLKLKDYYSNHDYTIYNEKKLIDGNGDIHIPDRLIFDNNKVIIIDYKTGEDSSKYKRQLDVYADVLVGMGYFVVNKFLVFLNESLEVKEVS